MQFKIAGIWRSLAWGCAQAGRPSIQIQLASERVFPEEDETYTSISFQALVHLLTRPLRQLHTVQIHAVSFDAQGQIVSVDDPLSQTHIHHFITYLLGDFDNRVIVHTNNATDISLVDPRTNVVLTPIMPSRGDPDVNYWPNLNYLSEEGEILFTLDTSKDYHWMKQMVARYSLSDRFTVYVTIQGHPQVRDQWAKQIIKDSLQVHLLPPVPFTPLPIRVDRSFRQRPE
ncbi:MAG: hypothetical protein K9N46_12060 [Candidatus Marinimicrobia bacterium]|nr:hypothetical protein [Candidatus Neomarinimicrobiota bacterium]MCF7827736.1 hypothetical protein [Candidatus Neomarinimicrobiota bacterium]MCF7881464.1 hypothetical protein [Candidatus Neomarinimicrobiota bacterium]